MIDGPRDVPMVTNAYGVRYPAHTDDHPAYTIDAKFACNAAKYSETHQCACVYRQTVCNGSEHLCMCGDSWTDKRACYCPELHHHEKEENTMSTPVGLSMKAHMGDFEIEVTIKAKVLTPQSVLAEHQRRAAKAMAILLTESASRRDEDDYDGPDF